ncbi:hypothetical protein [Williamwhitmania taraxaci]|uniref:Uncharacterized protein n=1 Tax=Williamwhitmania taraxaci TaxID=1640674 RepID=A0A1G6MS64_9BACT|nr:hypothetical protein [Williamwhitmania taraxaci]SDC58057.1 hypothetical protein SAMN05216323_10382 [Williamwhitmania taraxaci]
MAAAQPALAHDTVARMFRPAEATYANAYITVLKYNHFSGWTQVLTPKG